MIVIYIQPFPRKIQKIKTASGTFMVEFRKRNKTNIELTMSQNSRVSFCELIMHSRLDLFPTGDVSDITQHIQAN
jgi:hypothetical protein